MAKTKRQKNELQKFKLKVSLGLGFHIQSLSNTNEAITFTKKNLRISSSCFNWVIQNTSNDYQKLTESTLTNFNRKNTQIQTDHFSGKSQIQNQIHTHPHINKN